MWLPFSSFHFVSHISLNSCSRFHLFVPKSEASLGNLTLAVQSREKWEKNRERSGRNTKWDLIHLCRIWSLFSYYKCLCNFNLFLFRHQSLFHLQWFSVSLSSRESRWISLEFQMTSHHNGNFCCLALRMKISDFRHKTHTVSCQVVREFNVRKKDECVCQSEVLTFPSLLSCLVRELTGS